MKVRIFFIALLLCTGAHAYQYVDLGTLRANDPFVFCRYGQKIPDPCWVPIAPYTGQWMYTGFCDEPNEYGRPWTSEDRQALSLYEQTCHLAKESGSWDGRHGSPESTPTEH
jgi:hypothetical protein